MKKVIVLLVSLASIFKVYGFQIQNIKGYCITEAELLYPQMQQDFKTLNSIAEVGYEEKRTQAYLLQKYRTLQQKYGENLIKIETIAGTGIWIELEGNPQAKKSIIVRQELDGIEYSNGNNKFVRHSCGHDWGLSVSASLAELLLKNRVFQFKKVIIIHSPSEEEPKPRSGLDSILFLKSRELKKYGELIAIGQHVTKAESKPYGKSRTFQMRAGAAQASSQILRFTVDATAKQAGHIAIESNINALAISDSIRSEIYDKVKECAPNGKFLLRWSNVFTNKDSLSSYNVLALYSHCVGNFRAITPEHEKLGLFKIDSIIANWAKRYEKDTVKIVRANIIGNSVLVNDSLLVSQILKKCKEFGVSCTEHEFRYGADDFFWFEKYGIKSCLLRVFLNTEGNLHQSNFAITDVEALKISLSTFAYLIYTLGTDK